MGCPETLITDQGREFVNELSSELYQITNNDHRITSAYHPQVCFVFFCLGQLRYAYYYEVLTNSQSNGLTERFNQTLSRCLAKITDESHSDWDMKIDTVLLGYRALRQGSTKFSPYFMLFQQEMRLPIHNDVRPKSNMGECEKRDVSHVCMNNNCLMSCVYYMCGCV